MQRYGRSVRKKRRGGGWDSKHVAKFPVAVLDARTPLPTAALNKAHFRARCGFFEVQSGGRRTSRNKGVRDIPIFIVPIEIYPEAHRWILKHRRGNLGAHAPL